MSLVASGGHRKLTVRRVHDVPARALVCPAGHKHKAQPHLLGPVGVCCSFRPPPGDAGVCGVCAAYLPLTDGKVRVVECTSAELIEMGELRMDAEAMAQYLGVALPLAGQPART